ncbi:MAG: gamma-glutamyl-gamma-aminobutyrate hydrolase family protein [Gammaproteobacteria bacterium]|nr:gamma-glutamyl-gamma-aminobutyrate hydrolase family protein [Gammaproteobacteria bacterium]
MTNMQVPLIGVTAANDPAVPGHYILRWDYVRGVEAAGGIAVILAPTRPSRLAPILDRLDAVVLSGGLDVSPQMYGGGDHITIHGSSLERDEFEAELILKALERDLPLLGICRGMQMMNVVRGGDLIQDIPSAVEGAVSHNQPGRPRDAIVHSVSIHETSRLYDIVGRSRIDVNSFHHQAIGAVGEGMVVTSRSTDGVVEGAEIPGYRFVVGIQWHPETLWPLGPPFASIFDALVREAGVSSG